MPRSIRRIVLLETRPPDIHIFRKFALPRLGVVLLGTILRDLGYEVQVMVEEVKEFDFDAIARADLVGISVITATAGRSYTIADQLREKDIPVVMGGAHVTHQSEDALGHCDYAVRGEGELALPALLEALQQDGDLAEVPNLSWVSDGQVVHNDKAPLVEDLDCWPDPDMSLVEGFGVAGFLASRRVVPIQTSRGCPHDCSFCSVTATFGRKMRYRSAARVVEQMRGHDLKKTVFFFYDDNFAASPRRVNELLDAFATLPRRPIWSVQVRADVARDEKLLDRMKAAGCETVFIGLESVNQESLTSASKRQDLDEVSTYLQRFVDRKIRVHGMFVFGFDDDHAGTMHRTVAFAKKHKLFSVQFLILTPLPGSRTFDEMETQERILMQDWSLYDAHHVCFRPASVTPAELQRWQVEGHARFYTLGEAARRMCTGKLTGALLVLYARHINIRWTETHEEFLGVLDQLSAPRPGLPAPVYRRDYSELKDQMRRALAVAPSPH
jgi:radical SAM superfamily enzyme YgiQ (UPF0313 family)